MEASALADRVVHVNERCGSLAEFIVGVLPIVHSADECRAVLDELEHEHQDEHEGDDEARIAAARRLRLAELGGVWLCGGAAADTPVVRGAAVVTGARRSGRRTR